MNFRKYLFVILLQHLALTYAQTILRHHNPSHHSSSLDKDALLKFKKGIVRDPTFAIANWDETTDVCNFTGVTCNKHQTRVSKLKLVDTQLVGLLSPFISNLTRLHILRIEGNQLYGSIPPEFSSLRLLTYLRLADNNLQGPIPQSLGLLSRLNLLHIKGSNINGTLPTSLFSNCTILYNIDFSGNYLTGNIPEEIGNCSGLWNINLYDNNFTGPLPLSLSYMTDLTNIDVENNLLSGELPSEIVRMLPNLAYLHLSHNRMKSHDGNINLDPFFIALGNCSGLMELQLAGIGLGGQLPSSIDRIRVSIKSILLQENQLFGSIPANVANLSHLLTLNLTSNLLNGIIAEEISRLPSLEQLFLSHNAFAGAIPSALAKFPSLGLLDLSHNNFSGLIPASLGNLTRLRFLFLNNNLLSGKIPPTLGQCIELYKLDLSHNQLTGPIPPELAGMREIRIFINLSHNCLEGTLPIELSKMRDVQEMDLSSNNLTGSILPQISSCIAVMKINFSNNYLEGPLPESLGELRNLESLDLSEKRLSGTIPISLARMHTKRRLFHSTVFLIIFVLVIVVSAFLSMICCVIGIWRIRGIIHSGKIQTVRKTSTPELIHNFPRITHKELSDATAGFDDQGLIGSGSYGRVYRGVLSGATAIAVKVLYLQSGNSTKTFTRECQVLKRIRHRNLIRIITVCSLPDFKALVFPYMVNGSLDSCLYPHSNTGSGSTFSDLSLVQRVNICSDVAEGMAYLHHHSPARVIHCNLKPSNVLLNEDMTALVSDFGIAKLVMIAGGGNGGAMEMGNSTAKLLCGSSGYIAPEYGFGSTTSTKGDVYSFGILVLEMVTRKRPTDDMFVGGLSLQKWVKNHFLGRMERVIDLSLVTASRDDSHEVKKMWEVAIGELLELGILCTQESPSMRPTMLDAAEDLIG
ncbi:hypothetical protein CJ030_MR3G007321 [Morella rubra]|uniref:non-specific serine/threonine protein kinase n=1 Tax=Morella rubra TaxID=262757 RepID=A0A6A1W0S8_9ROSI|nr:hypothetical protein CJ030_MR3G007321 [Morella rubra]